MLLSGQRMIPAGLPFHLDLQEVVQPDEMQLDKMFGATAGGADMSRRFLHLLFSSSNIFFLWIPFISIILESVFFAPLNTH